MLHISHAVVRLVPIDMRVAENVDIAAKPAQLALQAARAAHAPQLFVKQPGSERIDQVHTHDTNTRYAPHVTRAHSGVADPDKACAVNAQILMAEPLLFSISCS